MVSEVSARELALRAALDDIRAMTDVGNPRSRRGANRDGCIDAVFARACEALNRNPTEDVSAQVRAILEANFWLPDLDVAKGYRRLQDDHDGTREGWLSVGFTQDGDVWVETTGTEPLRFRMPLIGGGMSPRTRTALVILAEAIRLDSEREPAQ